MGSTAEWIPIISENSKAFIMSSAKNCLIKFDDGSVVRFNEDWPLAIATHFKVEQDSNHTTKAHKGKV